MPLRIGNVNPAGLAIGENLIRGAAIGDNIIFNLGSVTPVDNLGIITVTSVGSGRTRTGTMVVTDADGFIREPSGTVTIRNGNDNNDIRAAAEISFSGSGNARSAALPGRRSAQRYRIVVTYSDSNGDHRLQVVTTPGSFSTSLQYEDRR